MDDRSIKRLGVIVVTAIVLILLFKSVGLRIATKVGQEHQKALATRQAPPAAAPESAPLATPEPASAASALPDAGVGAAPDTAAASGVR